MKSRGAIIGLLLGIGFSSAGQKPMRSSSSGPEYFRIPDSLTYDVPSIATYINSTCSTQADKAKAIFTWMADQIIYETGYNEARKDDPELIDYVLKNKKGVCAHYAALYNACANSCGIKTYVIHGYIQQNGAVPERGHAWVVSEIESEWYPMDPTWGAGGLSEDNQYKKQLDLNHFMCNPQWFVRTHMPLDPMWQLMEYPITHAEFNQCVESMDSVNRYFNYKDSIVLFQHRTKEENEEAFIRRVNASSEENEKVQDEIARINREMGSQIKKKRDEQMLTMAIRFNQAGNSYSFGVERYKLFLNYYRHHFKPEQPEEKTKAMLDEVERLYRACLDTMSEIKTPTPYLKPKIKKYQKIIGEKLPEIQRMQVFVKKYYHTPKIFRRFRFLFRKRNSG